MSFPPEKGFLFLIHWQDPLLILACVGLAQNFAALRALANEGIQKGHMKLHARNIAISAGAKDDAVDKIVNIMLGENNISYSRALELLKGDKNGEL